VVELWLSVVPQSCSTLSCTQQPVKGLLGCGAALHDNKPMRANKHATQKPKREHSPNVPYPLPAPPPASSPTPTPPPAPPPVPLSDTVVHGGAHQRAATQMHQRAIVRPGQLLHHQTHAVLLVPPWPAHVPAMPADVPVPHCIVRR
jgi:hypothetical protein